MKKNCKLIALLCVLCAASLTVSCGTDEAVDDTGDGTVVYTAEPYGVLTLPPDDAMLQASYINPQLAYGERGLPQAGAQTLLEEDFDVASYKELTDSFVFSQPEGTEVKDGVFTCPASTWYSMKVLCEYDLGVTRQQYEMSFDYQSSTGAQALKNTGLFVGCRVPEEMIATYPGGFWVVFSGASMAYVFPGGDNFAGAESYADKYFRIKLPVNCRKTARRITVVDTGSELCYYISTDDEEDYLVVKAVFDGTDIICYGDDGLEIWSGVSDVREKVDFAVFSHFTPSAVDNFTLRAY